MKSYYASIDHLLLLERLQGTGGAPNFFGQYFRRPTERDGAFWDYEEGIFLGRPTAVLDAGTRLPEGRVSPAEISADTAQVRSKNIGLQRTDTAI